MVYNITLIKFSVRDISVFIYIWYIDRIIVTIDSCHRSQAAVSPAKSEEIFDAEVVSKLKAI